MAPCLTLFLGSGGVFSNLWQGMGKVWPMAHALPLPEGRMESDHDLSPCPLERWRIVASVLLKY